METPDKHRSLLVSIFTDLPGDILEGVFWTALFLGGFYGAIYIIKMIWYAV